MNIRVYLIVLLAVALTSSTYCSEGHLVLQTNKGAPEQLRTDYAPAAGTYRSLLNISWSPDGRFLAAITLTGVALYETKTGMQIYNLVLQHNGKNEFIKKLAWGENSLLLLYTNGGLLSSFSVLQKRVLWTDVAPPDFEAKDIKHCGGNVFAILFSWALGLHQPNTSRITLYAVHPAEKKKTHSYVVEQKAKGVSCASYNPQQMLLAVASRVLDLHNIYAPSRENRLHILSVEKFKKNEKMDDSAYLQDLTSFNSEVRSMQWIDESKLAAALINGTIVLHNVYENQRLCEMKYPETAAVVSHLSLSCFGRYLALSEKNKVLVWDLFKPNDNNEPQVTTISELTALNTLCNTLTEPETPFNKLNATDLAWSPDSNRLALALADPISIVAHTLIILDLPTLEKFPHLLRKLQDCQCTGRKISYFTPDHLKKRKSSSHAPEKSSSSHNGNSIASAP